MIYYHYVIFNTLSSHAKLDPVSLDKYHHDSGLSDRTGHVIRDRGRLYRLGTLGK